MGKTGRERQPWNLRNSLFMPPEAARRIIMGTIFPLFLLTLLIFVPIINNFFHTVWPEHIITF